MCANDKQKDSVVGLVVFFILAIIFTIFYINKHNEIIKGLKVIRFYIILNPSKAIIITLLLIIIVLLIMLLNKKNNYNS